MRPGAPFFPVGLGTPRVHLRETDSTNERARALAARGAPHGTLVTAATQTAGRGRQGRTWSAPPGRALLMSLILRDPPELLPLIAAVAVCDAVDELTGGATRVKWPNDIVVPAAADASALPKLAGILVEGRPQEGWAVLGVGLNVAVRPTDLPDDVRSRATSLRLNPADVDAVLERVLRALDQRLDAPAAETLEAWRARDALRGREVRWSGGHGRADGVDGSGRLIVVLPGGGQTALGAGEVHLETGGEDAPSH